MAYIKKGPYQNKCLGCGMIFEATVPNTKYCVDCRKTEPSSPKHSTQTQVRNIGCLSEHIAVTELLLLGYSVYKNVSAHGEVDIIATNELGEITLFDVKTASLATRFEYVHTTQLSELQRGMGVKRLCVLDVGHIYIDDGSNYSISVQSLVECGIKSVWGRSLKGKKTALITQSQS